MCRGLGQSGALCGCGKLWSLEFSWRACAASGSTAVCVLLRVPRPSGSSFTCAKRIPQPILRGLGRCGPHPKPSPRSEAWGECQSEVKGEAEGRRTRTAALTPRLQRTCENQPTHATCRSSATRISNVNSHPSPIQRIPCSASPTTALLSSPSSSSC